ncbi:unnamed protein product (mitochondrion) [Plasmodiophora brassicae]|uniref:Uncharacterized protein n=1 Tax=Plasmodiophora brassicae TaxID=37360 RepID=A0A0G4J0M6_PLABS|nr:hypothetical protein PBRA_008221 [Plasmodiophora brassicae]SPR01217.1 unnamed protein product [Plasmodiophora brassicae]
MLSLLTAMLAFAPIDESVNAPTSPLPQSRSSSVSSLTPTNQLLLHAHSAETLIPTILSSSIVTWPHPTGATPTHASTSPATYKTVASLSPWPTDASWDATSPTAWFGTQLPLLDVLVALMVLVSAVHSVVNTASGGPRQMKSSAPPKVTRQARMADSVAKKAKQGARKQATCRPPWRP